MMKLWGTHLSPFLLRALFCARLKGVDIPYEAPESTYAEAFRKLNPMGKVPVLVDDDFVLPESLAICEYIEEKFPGPSIWPDGLRERARARMLCQTMEIYVHPDMFNLFLPDLAIGPAKGASERLGHALDALEAHMRAGDLWLCGDRPTLPDAYLATILFYFEAIGVHYGGLELIAERHLLAEWWSRARADPMMARLIAEEDAAFWDDWKDRLPRDFARRGQ